MSLAQTIDDLRPFIEPAVHVVILLAVVALAAAYLVRFDR